MPSETRADPGGKLPPKLPFPAPPLGIRENLGGREGGELTLLGIENLTASFFFFFFFPGGEKRGRKYFTGGRFKKENLYLDCLEERNGVEDGLGNLSRLVSDSLRCIFLLTARSFCSRACQHFSQRKVPGNCLGRLAGAPRAHCVTLRAVGIGIALLGVQGWNKEALLGISRFWKDSAFNDGVELM